VPVGAPSATPDRRPFRIQATGSGGKVYTAFPATNGQPGDFKDATQDIAPIPSWLVSGKWALLSGLSGFTGGVYHQDETGPYPHVSIRRYAGSAFGSNGALPAKYRIAGAMQPFAMTDHMPPIGENGFLVYYRNPKTYVELVVAGGNVAVWSSDNAGPDGNAGWTGHYWYGQKTNAGDIRRLAAEIDTNAHTLTYWVEGQKAASLTIPLLANTVGHTFALRSIGNKINFGELLVQDLTGDMVPAPNPTPNPTPKPTPIPQPTATATATATATSAPTPSSGLKFQSVGSLPQGRVWHGAALAGNGKVYISGGTNGASGFDTVWNSALGQPWQWQGQTSLPQATEGHGFVIIGNYAYTLGGWTRNSGNPRADVYKAAIGSNGSLGPWQATTSLPAGRVYAGWVVNGNTVLAIGGLGPNWGPQSTVWQATADSQGHLSAWQTVGTLPEPRAWPGCAIAGGKLWVTGGSAGKLTKASVFAASYSNGQLGSWASGPSLPQPIEAQATVVLNGVLTVCGGDDYSSGTPSPTAAILQLTGGGWKTVGQMPLAGFGQMPVVSGNNLYLFGGHDAAHNVLNSIWKTSF
jgi:N-acetylneuraminic acid mutarotase